MKNRPNILVFMTDQQNAATINPDHMAKTPNMDRFLKKAVHFTESYCPAPHCCPSRATFFTGLYPSQHGVWNNVEIDNTLSRGVFDNIEMFPQELQKAGYNTYFSGKWHVSAYEGPLDRGFDVVLREYISNYGRAVKENLPKANDWEHVYSGKVKIDGAAESKDFGRIIKEGYPTYYQFGSDPNPFGDTDSVNLACRVIENYSDNQPFFMYVGATGPHDPYCPPREFIDMYDLNDIHLPENFADEMKDKPELYRRTRERFALTQEEHLESIRRYLAFCSYEDFLFGKLLDTVNKKGIADHTIIIYLTDHGDYLGAHGLWAKGLPCFREAYNICAAIGGADIHGGIRNEELVSLADFAPTIMDLAGIKSEMNYLGRSLVPLLYNQKAENWRTEMYTQTNGNELYGIQRAVWNKKWKYVYNGFAYDELYDLENDPLELKNLIHEKSLQPVIKEMCKKIWAFAKQTKDNCTCPYIMVSLAPYGPGIILEK